jgi:hypothetical protein
MIKTHAVCLRVGRALCTPLSLGVVLGSCSENADVVVRISVEPSHVSVTTPITMTVVAENASSRRVTWGQGSSSCQLGAVVRVGQESREVFARRACTADLIEQGLDAGESRTESWEWGAEVFGEMGIDSVSPGTYLVRGAAGTAAFSEELAVVVEPPAN